MTLSASPVASLLPCRLYTLTAPNWEHERDYTMTLDNIATIAKNVTEHKAHNSTKKHNTMVIMCEVEIMEVLTSNEEYRKQVKKAILKKEVLREYDHDILRLIEVASL